jgi:hypothetical protein
MAKIHYSVWISHAPELDMWGVAVVNMELRSVNLDIHMRMEQVHWRGVVWFKVTMAADSVEQVSTVAAQALLLAKVIARLLGQIKFGPSKSRIYILGHTEQPSEEQAAL